MAYHAGEVRDSDLTFPELIGYEVVIGTVRAADSADVPAALVSFEAGVQAGYAAAGPHGVARGGDRAW